MPASLTIGAFVLGGVLLLIAVLRGGFKLFGAEVSGTAGGGGRLIAFITGIVLLVTAFISNGRAPASDRDQADDTRGGPVATSPVDDAGSGAPSQAPVVQQQSSITNKATDLLQPETAGDPREARPRAAVKVEWSAADRELQDVFSHLTNDQKVMFGFAALMAGKDIYGIAVRITNTGRVPVHVSPQHLRLTYNGTTFPLTSAEDARFLRATQLQPNEYVQGLLMYEAPLLGGQSVSAGGRLSYNDPNVTVSFR
jgi:hypothetical protein